MFSQRKIRPPVSGLFSKLVLALGLVAIVLIFSTCGGGGTSGGGGDINPPVLNTFVQFRMGDAYYDRVISVEATLDAVYLKNSSGAFIKVVPVSHRLEFSHLAGTMTPLYLSEVPQGSYSQLKIDGGQLHVTYLDMQGTPQEYTFTDTTSVTVPLNSFTLGSQKTIAAIDFDLSQSIVIDPTNQTEPSVNPVFSVSLSPINTSGEQEPEDGAVEDLVGLVSGVSGNKFVLTARDNSSMDIFTDANTEFDGVSLDTLPTTIVKVDGATQADGSLLATKVEAYEGQGGVEIEGLYIASNFAWGKEIMLVAHEGVGAGLMTQDEAMGRRLRVDVNNADFSFDADGVDMSGMPFTKDNIAAGGRVRVLSSTQFVRGDSATTTNLVAQKVILEKQCLAGTVMNYQAGPPATFNLAFDGNTFLKVLSPALNSVVVYQQPGTHLKGGITIKNGDVVYVRGLLFMTTGASVNYHLVAERIWK